MPGIMQDECWFKIGSVRYGPAFCEVWQEAAVSDAGGHQIVWGGSFKMAGGAARLPHFPVDAEIVFSNGERHSISFDSIENHTAGTFTIFGDPL